MKLKKPTQAIVEVASDCMWANKITSAFRHSKCDPASRRGHCGGQAFDSAILKAMVAAEPRLENRRIKGLTLTIPRSQVAATVPGHLEFLISNYARKGLLHAQTNKQVRTDQQSADPWIRRVDGDQPGAFLSPQ
jgi:hypothetical protein